MINENQEIAKQAYKELIQAIVDLEIKHKIYCDVPKFIAVNGEHFTREYLSFIYLLKENGIAE